MKNKEIPQTDVVEIPELKINDTWKSIMNRVSHVQHIFWVISFATLLVFVATLMPDYIWRELWVSIKSQGVLVSLILIFGLIAVSLVWSDGQRIDVWIFLRFNMSGQRPKWLDWLMLSFTQMGNFIFALALAFILYFSGNQLLAYELILGILGLGLVVQLMKVIIRRTRPYIKLKNIRIVGSRESGRSFPSGHTSQAFFMATLLLHYFHVTLFIWFILYAIALFVGITRIYVGMHYPRDVLGGAMLGTACGLFGIIINSHIFI